MHPDSPAVHGGVDLILKSKMFSHCFSCAPQEPATAETAAAAKRTTQPRFAPNSPAVSLAGQRLTEVPAELWDNVACLTHLDLSNNQLCESLAERLASCAQLKVRTAAQPVPSTCSGHPHSMKMTASKPHAPKKNLPGCSETLGLCPVSRSSKGSPILHYQIDILFSVGAEGGTLGQSGCCCILHCTVPMLRPANFIASEMELMGFWDNAWTAALCYIP